MGARGCLLLAITVSALFGNRAATDGRPEMHNALENVSVGSIRLELDASVQVWANVTHIDTSGSWVEVSWSGVEVPSYDDWIALIVPADAEITETSPAKFKMAAAAETHLSNGSGSLRFRLINYRHPVRFLLLRNGLKNAVAAGQSQVISFRPNEPLQGHLALASSNREMLVQWVTHNSPSPEVRWGEASGQYRWAVSGRTVSYDRLELCGPPATTVGYVHPGSFHFALLTGLEPGRRYFYIYGDEQHGFSGEASFTAAPPTGPEVEVDIIALADMGQGEVDGSNEQSEMVASLNTTGLVNTETTPYQLLMHSGDISYARGYVTQWDNFMHQIEPIATRMPYMVGIGNHERDWPGTGDRFQAPGVTDSGGECGVPHERRLLMPTPCQDCPWYSYDFGPMHILVYSTEHDFSRGSEQWRWVKADLESVDRRLTPWIIVTGHRPFYISSVYYHYPDGDQDVAEALRDAFEALFLLHKVDMTWHGHHHSYQRTCPVFRSRCMGWDEHGVAKAPVHLVIGNAGAGLCLNIQKPQPAFFEKVHLWWGYLRVHANGTNLRVAAVSDADGEVFDSLELTKPADWGRQYHARHGPPAAAEPVRPHWYDAGRPSAAAAALAALQRRQQHTGVDGERVQALLGGPPDGDHGFVRRPLLIMQES